MINCRIDVAQTGRLRKGLVDRASHTGYLLLGRKVAADFQENTNAILGKGDIKKNVILVVRVGLGLRRM